MQKTPTLSKKKIIMRTYIINMHRITLNMQKMVLLQMVPHTKLPTLPRQLPVMSFKKMILSN